MKSLNEIISYFIYDESVPEYLLSSIPVTFYIENNGYWVVKVNNNQYKVHRIVYKLNNSDFDESLQIDHIDGVRTNNLISNLRAVTHSENMKNKGLYSSNKTGYVGITRRTVKGIDYIRVYVRHNGLLKEKYLNVSKYGGYTKCLIKAVEIREQFIKGLNFSERHGK